MSKFQWAMVSACMMTLAGCRETTVAPAPSTTTASSTSLSSPPAHASLTRVTDVSAVCMVNDQFMGSPQIPVTVAGKTYFGCCAMCKQKLENNESARTATDPVSGKRVDKASAVIARNAAGRVFYFESEETMGRHQPL